jgi:hypothetical protein
MGLALGAFPFYRVCESRLFSAMRAISLAAAVTALRFAQRNAILHKVADFEASTVAYQKSRSDLVDAIVADFEASSVAYQKSQPDSDAGSLSAELESAELALSPQQSGHEFNEDKFLDEVYHEAQDDKRAEAASKAALYNTSESRFFDKIDAALRENEAYQKAEAAAFNESDNGFFSRVEATHSLFSHAREEETKAHTSHKTHVIARIRAHSRARAHAQTVDVPDYPAQQDLCDPGITVCLPCDGTDISDTSLIPRVLQSIAEQSCLPSRVILAVSGVNDQQAAELLEGLPDYNESFPVQTLATEKRQNAGLNRNRCARAADTEVVSFFDVDDIMHPRRLEMLSFAFGNYHPKAVVHAYEETPKYMCNTRAPPFKSLKFGNTFQIFDGIGIYDLSMTPDADRKNSLRTPNAQGLNHAGHISVLRSVFSEVQQSNLARGQDAKFARDILRHFGRKEDTMACLNVPLTLYCHQGQIRWHML